MIGADDVKGLSVTSHLFWSGLFADEVSDGDIVSPMIGLYRLLYQG